MTIFCDFSAIKVGDFVEHYTASYARGGELAVIVKVTAKFFDVCPVDKPAAHTRRFVRSTGRESGGDRFGSSCRPLTDDEVTALRRQHSIRVVAKRMIRLASEMTDGRKYLDVKMCIGVRDALTSLIEDAVQSDKSA